jgi:hypothetical protein
MTVLLGRGPAGVNVTVRLSEERAAVPAMDEPFAVRVKDEPALIPEEKVMDGFTSVGMSVAPGAGTCSVTVRGAVGVAKTRSTR